MTIKKHLIAFAAAAVLTLPASAQANGTDQGLTIQPNPVYILIGLLLPAVQKARKQSTN